MVRKLLGERWFNLNEPFAAIERILDVAPHYAGIAEDEFKAARSELEAARKLLRDLAELAEKWRKERAHTYASENADHYRGFDDGRLRSAQELERLFAVGWSYSRPRGARMVRANDSVSAGETMSDLREAVVTESKRHKKMAREWMLTNGHTYKTCVQQIAAMLDSAFAAGVEAAAKHWPFIQVGWTSCTCGWKSDTTQFVNGKSHQEAWSEHIRTLTPAAVPEVKEASK